MTAYDQFGEADDLEEWEEPDDFEDDGDSETVSCPECEAEIYEDAEQCPRCGAYVVHGTSPLVGRPIWWIVLGLAGIAAAAYAFVRFF